VDLVERRRAVREHAVAGLDEVKLAILEVDGTISVVPKGTETIRTHSRFRQRRHQN
jgi:uncharacterized membrane protein YcaP (DUF421 family)